MMKLVGGKGVVRDAVIGHTGLVYRQGVDQRPAEIPRLRETYVDVVSCLFVNDIASNEVRKEFSRMRKDHKQWEFSDHNFSIMEERFGFMFEQLGIHEHVVAKACSLFQYVREPATDSYREKALRASQMNTVEWRLSHLNDTKRAERIKKFAVALQTIVVKKEVGAVPQSWHDVEVIGEHLRKYFGGDHATPTLLPFDHIGESNGTLLLECAQAALNKAGFDSDEASILLADFDGHAKERLNKKLSDLYAHSAEVAKITKEAGWMGIVLQASG
eukprot:CAMPEP_0117473976 /NCGR_PEP_ID=MMETSP0784-20121206/9046_1 /TAXON_ID=39447 /ORGANISM="" /LENGTH=272 /DNA_ID=CAMNT_0005268187 /DNA_START=39 /DNA_END=854 /DNA_ORIENTATION=-